MTIYGVELRTWVRENNAERCDSAKIYRLEGYSRTRAINEAYEDFNLIKSRESNNRNLTEVMLVVRDLCEQRILLTDFYKPASL